MSRLVKEPGDRRQQILTAAMDVFGHKGFHRAKIEEIAVQAGLGKGTVYEYFRSKEELFEEMLRAAGCLYLDDLRHAIAPDDTVRNRLKAMLVANLEFINRSRDMARVIAESHPGGMDRNLVAAITELRHRLIGLVKGILVEGMERGELRSVDPTLCAHLFLAITRVFWGLAFFDGQQPDPQAAERALDLFWKGVEADV